MIFYRCSLVTRAVYAINLKGGTVGPYGPEGSVPGCALRAQKRDMTRFNLSKGIIWSLCVSRYLNGIESKDWPLRAQGAVIVRASMTTSLSGRYMIMVYSPAGMDLKTMLPKSSMMVLRTGFAL